ncbi:MAG: aspartate kinase, partial [bacterium]|nr:aspartate kinase [bacterium]
MVLTLSPAKSPILVQKYGGSSVATPSNILKVANLIKIRRSEGNRICVVISAMGKTTDQLLAMATEISKNPSRRELDMLLSCGERASMALLAMALQELQVPSISFTGSQSGIITDDVHSGAKIIEVRPSRVLQELELDKVVIVAGFQGVSYKKEITTLGRGGSDTTAIALTAALGA